MDVFSEVAYEGISVSDNSTNFKNTETNNDGTVSQDGEAKIISKRSAVKSGLLFLTCIGAVVVCIAQIGLSRSVWSLLGIGNEKKGECYPIQPAKMSGGGRDWILNVEDGTISSKHATDLVLGMGPMPVKLVKKGSPTQFVFDDSVKSSLADGESAPLLLAESSEQGSVQFGIGKLFEEAKTWGGWRVLSNIVVPAVKALQVELVHDNFIKLVNEKMVLTVSFWNIEIGSDVIFLGDKSEGYPYSTGGTGGGSDWVLNDDGTIATRKNADLVLGGGISPMVLVPKGSPRQLVFENIELLAAGEPAPLTFSSPGNGELAVGKKSQVNFYGCYPYIESGLRMKDHAVSARFEDGNFLMLDGQNFATDVSAWDLSEGSIVNFVSSTG